MTIKESIEQFKKLSEHDQKEVLNLIRLKNEFKKQEIERKAKAYDELIDYLQKEEEKLEKNELNYSIDYYIDRKSFLEEILNKIEKR